MTEDVLREIREILVPEHAHGVNGYYNYRCRCDVCRVAASEYHQRQGYQRAYREKNRERPCPDRFHGTVTGYTEYGCRCDRCREASSIRRKQQRKRVALRNVDNS